MSNELGNTPADKDYKPSGFSRSEEAALKAYPHYTAENITEVTNARHFFAKGYETAEKDTKDALLEWAEDVKQGLIVEMGKYGVPNEQRIFAFQEFIDKINSL